MQDFQLTNERDMNQSHYSISVVIVGILILDILRSGERDSCEKIFQVADILFSN